ncbi:DUF4365 domain-containing protein [Streptomyces globisporus]|uniref:DUF4365 domain-containing protein n=1 Tax=Streptomyces globisporus TaxID=1908 RepID=UPI00380CED0B
MRASEQEQTGGAGVSRVIADFTEIGWGPSENTRHDLGIDLFLQVRDERRFDRVILMAAQVKSGTSYFNAPTSDDQGACTGWWYAESDARHFEDWVQHAMPHLLVMHDDATRTSYWAHVTKEAVHSTGSGYKIHVPVHQKVELSNRDKLLKVAASAKQQPALQGTSFAAGAKAVAPGRALRHALLTPRLIAPHRNTGYERALAPEEAIALITQGRVQDLQWYIEEGFNPHLAAADSRSRVWEWRFFSAYYNAVVDSDIQPLLDLAVAACPASTTGKRRGKQQAEQAYRIAASVVTSATFLTAGERLTEAETLLEAAGEDLLPIDHAWVLVHRAIVMSEQGNLDTSRRLAAAALRTVAPDLDDVTAAAIGASAADFLYRTSGSGAKDLGATMTAVDTASSWWRSQSVAWALEAHEEKTFRSWGEGEDPGTWPSAEAQSRLLSAWLSASLAGTRGPSAAALAQHARHEITEHEAAWRSNAATELNVRDNQPRRVPTSTHTRSLEDTLDELRRFGCTKTLQTAVQRLWAAGPASPVQAAVQRSVSAPWTHTNAPAKLALLRYAGDLLPRELADQAGRHCLTLLEDPEPFAQRVRPWFTIDHYAHRALWRVLSAASDVVHAETADVLLRVLPDRPGEHKETDLIKLAAHMRPAAVTAFSSRLRMAATDASPAMSAALLGVLIASGDSAAEAELMRRTEAGDIDAIGEVRSPADLSPRTGKHVIGLAASHCHQHLEEAQQNSWGLGGWDWARLLTLCNFSFPEHARWGPVIDIVLDHRIAQEHKAGAVRALTTRADQLPAPVATRLQAAFSTGLPTIRGVPGLTDEAGVLTEASFALGLALGAVDSTTALRRILTWLRGSASHRRSAARLVSALSHHANEPIIQGTLVALTGDPQYQIRAAAAFSLTRGLQEHPAPAVTTAIATAANEPGCRVPLAVAHALDRTPVPETHYALRSGLHQHMSALVRSAAKPPHHLSPTANTPRPAPLE